jgi:hypothetical protein
MTSTPKSASGGTARHDAVEQVRPPGADTGPFVLNLCSSTTPMALAKAEQPELKRFSFFVSRRFEEGRERFRLHMGYFASLAEAEEWLGAVRDIYPGAWAGEAPGKKLRERAVAAAAAQAQHAAGPPPVVIPPSHTPRSASPAVRTVPTLPVAPPEIPSIQLPAMNVPTIHAATPPPIHAFAPQNGHAPIRASVAQTALPPGAARNVPAARPAPVALNSGPAARQVAPAARVPVATSTAFPTGPSIAPKAPPAQKGGVALNAAMVRGAHAPSNVPAGRNGSAGSNTFPARNGSAMPNGPALLKAAPVIPVAAPRHAPVQHQAVASPARPGAAPASAARPAALAAARAAPAAVSAQPAKAAAAANSPRPQGGSKLSARQNANRSLPNSNVREVLKALDEAPDEAETTGETRMMPAPVISNLEAVSGDNNFTDTQVLSFLETRRADSSDLPGIDVDTGAISLLKPDDTGTRRALKEAVTENAPVWFAVQLQWSVQPVELSKVPPLAIFRAYTLYTVEGSRDGRKWFGLRLGFFSDAISAKQVAYYVRSEFTAVAVVPVSPQERTRASDVDKKGAPEIGYPKKTRSGPVDEFKLIDSDETAARPTRPAAKPAPVVRAQQAAPAIAKRAAKSGNTVRARERRGPQTLEETLEILGAGELEMDNGNGETMNESGVRHLRVEVQKNTPFGRLLERLSERVRKP